MRTAAALLVIALLAPLPAVAAIYGWVDDEGVYHMTNIRPPGAKKYHVVVPDSPKPGTPLKGTYRNEYDEAINRHAQTQGMDPHLVKAVMIAESNGNPRAISHKGAQGLMQIMPDTASLLALRDPFDPEVAGRLRRYVYASGGALPPAEAYRAFRGRDPSVGPLLAQRGLADVAQPA